MKSATGLGTSIPRNRLELEKPCDFIYLSFALVGRQTSTLVLVERFRETDHMLGWSFRGATEGGEPGMTRHMIRISKSLY